MLQLVVVLFFAFLSMTLVLNLEMIQVKRQGNVVYQNDVKEKHFFGGDVTSVLSFKTSEVVETDTDELYDTCYQGIIQIVATLSHLCGNDPVKNWSWALQASQPPYDLLDDTIDYSVDGKGCIVLPSTYIDLKNIPSGTYVSSLDCSNDDEIREYGAYLYSTYLRPLGCDRYKLNLNGIYTDTSHISYLYKEILTK